MPAHHRGELCKAWGADMPTPIQFDTRPDQAHRVALFLEKHPRATAKEIDAACDVGCVTKVLSDMPRLGYGLARDWLDVLCVRGQRTRRVRIYRLLHWPHDVPDLFSQ